MIAMPMDDDVGAGDGVREPGGVEDGMMAMLMDDDDGAGDGVREPGGVEEGRQEDHHRCHGSGLPFRPGRETGRHEGDII